MAGSWNTGYQIRQHCVQPKPSPTMPCLQKSDSGDPAAMEETSAKSILFSFGMWYIRVLQLREWENYTYAFKIHFYTSINIFYISFLSAYAMFCSRNLTILLLNTTLKLTTINPFSLLTAAGLLTCGKYVLAVCWVRKSTTSSLILIQRSSQICNFLYLNFTWCEYNQMRIVLYLTTLWL